jgi:tetratricopeptide (TPR) repeat protein
MNEYFWEFSARLILWIAGTAVAIGLVAFAAFRLGGLPLLPKPSPENALRDARALADEGKHQEALIQFNEAIDGGTRDPSALLARGACLLDLGRPAEAEKDFVRFAESQPGNADAMAQIGRARAMQEDHAGALAAFDRSLSIDKDAADVWYWKAGALFRLGRDAEAEDAYGRAIGLNPLLGAAFEGRAQVRLQLRQFAPALDDFTVARQLMPVSPTLLSGFGLALMALGRLPEAEAAFSEAIRMDPASPRTLHNRALARFAMGQNGPALQDAEEALRRDPSLQKVHLLRGMVLANENRHADAIPCLSEAIRLDPSDAEAYRHRATSLRALGQLAAAQQDEALAAPRPQYPAPIPTPALQPR